jgi:hypothetical protein
MNSSRALVLTIVLAPLVACATTDGGMPDDPGAGPAIGGPSAPASPGAPAATCDDANPPKSDPANCGRCGKSCLGGACADGACRPYAIAAKLTEYPIAIAVDATDVYWITNVGSIVTCPIGGCIVPKPVLTGQGSLSSIAIDDASVYFTVFGTAAGSYKDGAVVRVAKTGGAPTTLAQNQAKPGGIQTDATNVYWTESDNPGAIDRCAKTGCNLAPTALASGATQPSGTSMDGSSLYWGDQLSGRLMKVDKNAGPPTPLTSYQGTILGTAVDATNVYFAQFDKAGRIVRTSKDGTSTVVLAEPETYSESVAVDDERVYWTTTTSVWSADKTTGQKREVVDHGGSIALPRSLVATGTNVFWCENGNGRIMRLVK